MPSKKRHSRQPAQPSKSDLRKWRSALKAQGLFGKRVKLNKPITAQQKRVISKYKDVATGKAKAFHVAKKDAPKMRRLFGLKGKDDIVIVPKSKGEKITYSKKTGEIKIKKGDRTKIIEGEFKPGKEI